MSNESYKHYANKWVSTKPIRGRAVDVRPIGERRRDWEQIVRKEFDDGTSDPNYSYAARLWQTDCVEYLPNGDIILRTGGWHTPSTAEFIHEHSPFMCWKQNGVLWVRRPDTPAYPLPKEMRFNYEKGEYVPAEPAVVHKRVVDRAKAKAAREPIMPFLAWAKMFLTMSDGWVMHSTMKEVFGWSDDPQDMGYVDVPPLSDMKVLDLFAQGDVDPEYSYTRMLCAFAMKLRWHGSSNDLRTAEFFDILVGPRQTPIRRSFYDIHVKYDSLKNMLYSMVEGNIDVHKVVEVAPSKKAMSRVVV